MGAAANWRDVERQIVAVLRGRVRPIGVAFLEGEPSGIQKYEGRQPSGCSFWRLAGEGRTFYTVPENHFNCVVGAYTHNIPLSPEHQQEAQTTLQMMFDLGYVQPEEVPKIPRLEKTPKAILYSPLGEIPVDPDVVLFALKPSGAMLLEEAAVRAGAGTGAPALGRPTCMALPASLQQGTIVSLGCIGNRIYTGLGEEEMYVVLRGKDLPAVAEALKVIGAANAALRDYARGRREQFSTP